MSMPTVVFDALGTLFDRAEAQRALTDLGAPEAALDAWFQRILHEAASVTILDAYRPFTELAESSLRTTLASLGLDPGRREPLDALQELDAYPDAEPALARLTERGWRVAVLTNGAEDSTESLLRRAGLDRHVDRVLSCDEVRAFKPAPAPYELAKRELGDELAFVAAHGWDVLGASACGLEPVWISRGEREWPFPFEPPRQADDLAGAATLLAG
jgi:2-haloacid dehalogenase